MADIDTTNLLLKLGQSLKEWAIPIAIGLGYLTWRMLRYLGLGFIDDVTALKKKSENFATRDELKECHSEVGEKIDGHYEQLRKDIRGIHSRVDDILLKKDNQEIEH